MRIFTIFALALTAVPALAQDANVNALRIATTLNNSQSQWVFNHICVPSTLLEGNRYTRGDFADAYIVVSKMRWQSALEALPENNEKESMKSLALVIHGVIDAYWPGRLERDAAGAITSFHTIRGQFPIRGQFRHPDTNQAISHYC